jgi:hypothetical protein
MKTLPIALAALLDGQPPPATPPGGPAPATSAADLAARTPDAENLRVTLVAGVWVPRLGGTSSLGAGAPDIDLATDLQLDTWEATPNVELAICSREFVTVTVSGFGFSTDSLGRFPGNATFGGVSLAPGDVYRASFDMTSVAFDIAFAVYRPFAPGSARAAAFNNRAWDGRPVADLRISPLFAMRWVDVDQSVESGGASAEGGGQWGVLGGGLTIELECRPQSRVPFYSGFRLEGTAALGGAFGGDGGFEWQVRAGLTVQFTEWVGLTLGYRLVELNVENDDYSLNGGLQGLFLAGSVRF